MNAKWLKTVFWLVLWVVGLSGISKGDFQGIDDVTQGLPPDASAALEGVLQRLSRRAGYPMSLQQLLQQWRNFVVRVEQGYADSIYEYMNELSVRDLLEEILRSVPHGLQKALAQWITPWDKRFAEATREIGRAMLPAVEQEAPLWWWFRIPKNPGEELEEDLRSEGLLEG